MLQNLLRFRPVLMAGMVEKVVVKIVVKNAAFFGDNPMSSTTKEIS